MDRLTEMEAFIAVVDQGGFTGAARRMGLSKSAISKYVASLELRLGARLLDRTTRRVTPTETGLAYYGRARRVVGDAGEADAMVNSMQAPPSGEIRIAVPRDFGVAQMAPALDGFLRDYPGLGVVLVLGGDLAPPAEPVDVTITVGPAGDVVPGALRLGHSLCRVVAAPAYLAAQGRPARIEDLASHSLLHATTEPAAGGWTLTAPSGEPRMVRTGGRIAANDGRVLLSACIAGLGLAYLPGFLTQEARAAGLIEDAIPGLPGERLVIQALLPRAEYTPPKVSALIDYLTAYCAGQTAW